VFEERSDEGMAYLYADFVGRVRGHDGQSQWIVPCIFGGDEIKEFEDVGVSGGSLAEGVVPVDDGLASARVARLLVWDAGSGSKSLLTSASLGDENSRKSKLINHGSIRSRFVEELSSPRSLVLFFKWWFLIQWGVACIYRPSQCSTGFYITYKY
jgi:hypothetical protein